MPGKSYKTNAAATGACFDDDLLYRHLEKMTTPEEEARIEQHLDECNHCFADVAALTEIVQTPITEAEKIEIAQTRKITPEQQVNEILIYLEKERSEQESFLQQFVAMLLLVPVWKRMRQIPNRPRGRGIPMWAAGFACVFWVTLISGSYSGIRYHNASNRLQQAESLLQYNYRISAEESSRLAGGYKSGIGMVMGDSIPPYLREASSLAKSALKSGWKSEQARQLLAKVFIINQEYDRADSIFSLIKAEAAKSAAVLNDLGVLNYEQRHWESAANYFTSAIQADSQFREALYNLALTKEKLGAEAEAIGILDDYLKLETDESWIAVATEFQEKLKAKQP